MEHEAFAESLNEIRKLAPYEIQLMLEVALEIHQQSQMGAMVKRMTAKTFETLINFNQFMVQGMWKDTDPLSQLPHFSQDVIKNYKKQLKTFNMKSGSIGDFCRLTPAQRKELNLFGSDTVKAQDVEKAIEQMPLCNTTFTAFVEGKDPSEDIMSSDMVTLKIKTTFENIGPNQQPGYVHAQRYPFLKRS